ncbi:ATP-binding protein [Streptomyces harbinensis]|uniref:AAA family ATPase n=1 Tax=Streptomyces harbinensis TaxID=1176198 RepID=UPI0033929425
MTPDLLRRARRIEERVRHAVAERRRTDPDPDDAFRGLYLSDERIHRLLDEGRTVEAGAPLADGDETTALGRAFGLTALDTELLLVALLPDLDDRFEAFYGYLNDDVTRRRPTIGLALGLCGLSGADARARDRLAPHSPLVEGGLLLTEDLDRPFLTRALRVPDRVTSHLLGSTAPDPRVAHLLVADEVIAPRTDASPLTAAVTKGAHLVYLKSPLGGTAHSLAVQALRETGRNPLTVNLHRLAEDPAPDRAVHLLVREARLTGAGLICSPVDALTPHHLPTLRLLTTAAVPVILSGTVPWDADWSARPPLHLSAPRLDPAQRAAIWAAALPGPVPADIDLTDLLAPFLLTPSQLAGAARTAAQSALLTDGVLHPDHISAGARAQNAAGLDRLARRIEPSVTWDDLVLPADTRTQLHELAARARHRDQVLGTWSMRPGGGRGRGVSALFAGDSGTGKTMSAEVIAADLGLDLYTVDLATVIDKYVGETEKNLERIFTEAAGINGVLLFDEADAIFGKRSEVKDAHDRYANVESAYLLQRMESFDGLAILSTNLRANLDDAFTRRLDLVIDFPLPDAADRRHLWTKSLGTQVPLSPDLDLDFCAESFELAGGNIRSIAITAAYLAATADTEITMPLLIRATQREYQKLGRLTLASEFGPYLHLIDQGGSSALSPTESDHDEAPGGR